MGLFAIVYLICVLTFAFYIIDTSSLVKNYKIVKFENNTYALRRGYYWFRYFDLKSNANFWWEKTSNYFITDCRGTLEEVRKKKTILETKYKEEIIE